MTKATESQLGSLHAKIAEVMTNALDNIPEGTRPNPALLSVIVRFLDANKITCAPEAGNEMGELEQKLAEKRSKRRLRVVGGISHTDEEDD
jgi:hypothetical protein